MPLLRKVPIRVGSHRASRVLSATRKGGINSPFTGRFALTVYRFEPLRSIRNLMLPSTWLAYKAPSCVIASTQSRGILLAL